MRYDRRYVALAILSGGCKVAPDALTPAADVPTTASVVSTTEDAGPVRGFCPKEHVVQPIAARSVDIQACYEKKLKRHRKLAGTVELSWTLGKDGRVATIESTGLEEVAPCIKDVLRSIAFPPPNHGCETVSGMKFTFQPG